ncbi:MAG: PatB family C-S lyase [Candidatus Sabulitectum sp.]|nr:PatB family C-S lyase [Candidatus Sabulitectum sp.]
MKYDFDKTISRSNTNCIKWDYLDAFFGESDLHAMWVADMDFVAPPEILDPIKDRAAHGVFGYTAKPDEFYSTVIRWFRRRYHWDIEREWIVTTLGVVPALNLAMQEFTEPGDGVIIQSPVYFPFKESVDLNGRELLDNTLILKDGHYEIDWQDLEEKAGNAKMFLFCSPHNPVSRVWTTGELEQLGDICKRHDLMVFSDEIHADIIFRPNRHVPTAMVSNDLASRTIAAYATSKTFNLAGLQLSVNIIPDNKLRERFKLTLERLHMTMSNIFGMVGTQAAYKNGERWLEELIQYLWQNYLTVKKFLSEEIPDITVIEPEGTYLLWLDCSKLKLSDEELAAFFVQKAHLALSSGALFGPGGSGFMRMNIGCPKQSVLKGLETLKRAMDDDSPLVIDPGPANVPDDC